MYRVLESLMKPESVHSRYVSPYFRSIAEVDGTNGVTHGELMLDEDWLLQMEEVRNSLNSLKSKEDQLLKAIER